MPPRGNRSTHDASQAATASAAPPASSRTATLVEVEIEPPDGQTRDDVDHGHDHREVPGEQEHGEEAGRVGEGSGERRVRTGGGLQADAVRAQQQNGLDHDQRSRHAGQRARPEPDQRDGQQKDRP